MIEDDRAASSVVGVALMVGVVVILAATVAVYAFGFGQNPTNPAPTVAQSSGELVEQSGSNGGTVNITHRGGDTVPVSEMEIVTTAECQDGGKTGRLVNLPVTGSRIMDANIEGADIFDESFGGLPDRNALERGQFAAGDTLKFRLPSSECTISSGDTVTVLVVHTPSQSVMIEQTLDVS